MCIMTYEILVFFTVHTSTRIIHHLNVFSLNFKNKPSNIFAPCLLETLISFCEWPAINHCIEKMIVCTVCVRVPFRICESLSGIRAMSRRRGLASLMNCHNKKFDHRGFGLQRPPSSSFVWAARTHTRVAVSHFNAFSKDAACPFVAFVFIRVSLQNLWVCWQWETLLCKPHQLHHT